MARTTRTMPIIRAPKATVPMWYLTRYPKPFATGKESRLLSLPKCNFKFTPTHTNAIRVYIVIEFSISETSWVKKEMEKIEYSPRKIWNACVKNMELSNSLHMQLRSQIYYVYPPAQFCIVAKYLTLWRTIWQQSRRRPCADSPSRTRTPRRTETDCTILSPKLIAFIRERERERGRYILIKPAWEE